MQEWQMQKIINYRALNCDVQKGQTLFTGSSLMEQFPVCELCRSAGLPMTVYNRGVGGFNSDQFLEQIDTMLFDLAPSVVFLNIGTNDMTPRTDGVDWFAHLMQNYERILSAICARLPKTVVYLMAFYPVCPAAVRDAGIASALTVRTRENLARVNIALEELAHRHGYHFINVNEGLTDADGYLRPVFAIDGIHLYASGYQVVFRNLLPYLSSQTDSGKDEAR